MTNKGFILVSEQPHDLGIEPLLLISVSVSEIPTTLVPLAEKRKKAMLANRQMIIKLSVYFFSPSFLIKKAKSPFKGNSAFYVR